jgi:hypothetical protein
MVDRTDELQEVLTDASRTQFAAVSAAVAFWSAWTESAAGYARGMADELTQLSGGEASSDDVIGRMVDLNREYLRKLTELPTVAVERFNEDIKEIERHRSQSSGTRNPGRSTKTRSSGTRKPQRRAKAKA